MSKTFFVILMIVGLLSCCEFEEKADAEPKSVEVSTIDYTD